MNGARNDDHSSSHRRNLILGGKKRNFSEQLERHHKISKNGKFSSGCFVKHGKCQMRRAKFISSTVSIRAEVFSTLSSPPTSSGSKVVVKHCLFSTRKIRSREQRIKQFDWLAATNIDEITIPNPVTLTSRNAQELRTQGKHVINT